jgi:glycosyltransferase involved in cell wall biosynthesis
MNKPKILMCSEASFLHSGYSTYAKEILTRLYKSNKYEIAEFASYGIIGDPRDRSLPWKYYPNAVREDDPRFAEYNSTGENAFGKWRFERVVLDFMPDIVFDIRDFWMNSYQKLSILRPFYNWVVMPTVDSQPQQEEWLDVYMDADAVLSYSEWGGKVLQDQTNNLIKYKGVASPAVDTNIFKPIDMELAREKLSLPKTMKIIGSVMRNQKRKLIPELIQSIRRLLDQLSLQEKELGAEVYLYLHTSYPDMGWNIPNLLKEHNMCKRVLFTYYCRNCKKIHAHTFTHSIKPCPHCGKKSAALPSVSDGVSSEQLSDIYNTFDIYVQYAICEGFGMPQVEAGACGVPIVSVNYSAMSDIVRILQGYPIQPQTFFKEMETEAYRVYPNNDQLVFHLWNYLKLDQNSQKEMRSKVRSLTESNFNWDITADAWMKTFDEIMANPERKHWRSFNSNYIGKLDINEFRVFNKSYEAMKYICNDRLQMPHLLNNMMSLNLLKYSDYGFISNGMNIKKFNFQNIVDIYNKYIENQNLIKYALNNKAVLNNEDYIRYANERATS